MVSCVNAMLIFISNFIQNENNSNFKMHNLHLIFPYI